MWRQEPAAGVVALALALVPGLAAVFLPVMLGPAMMMMMSMTRMRMRWQWLAESCSQGAVVAMQQRGASWVPAAASAAVVACSSTAQAAAPITAAAAAATALAALEAATAAQAAARRLQRLPVPSAAPA